VSALIVPMNVCALVVGNDDVKGHDGVPGTKDFARLTYDFGQLTSKYPYLGETVSPAPFETVSGDVLPAGVHLHWALPAALAHAGTAADTGKVEFKAAPNRWLVARLGAAGAPTPRLDVTAWVVESDRLWDPDPALASDDPNSRSRLVPLAAPGPSKVVQCMGRVTPLASWAEDAGGTFADSHTAVGFGIPSFAAAYPHAPNVFGIWDPMQDAAGLQSLTYLVAGWHSDPKNDPLTSLIVPAESTPAQALAAATGWTLAGPDLPARTLCAGALTGVPANLDASHFSARKATPIEVAVGHTGVEALSVLLAARDGGADARKLERALILLQEGVLSRLSTPNGLAFCEDRMHTNRFVAIPGGTEWTLERRTPGNDAARQPSPGDGTRGPVEVTSADLADAAKRVWAPLPQTLADGLDALNDLQDSADAARRSVYAARSQLFADWCKYMEIAYGDRDATLPSFDDAHSFVEATMDDLHAATKAAAHAAKKASDKAADLSKAAGSGFVLAGSPAARFWQPVEPVVLLCGDDLVRPDRYGREGQTGFPFTLPVRTSDELVGELTLTQPAVGVGAAELQLGAPDLGATPFAAELAALVTETALLDPDAGAVLEQAAAAKAHIAATPDLAAAITAAQDAARKAGPPALAFGRWSQPWTPLLLDWQLDFTPDAGADTSAGPYPPALLTGYRFDEQARELVAPAAGTGEPHTYHGTALLTGTATLPLSAQIDDYLAASPKDPEAAALLKAKADLGTGILAQALSGLGAAFLMRHQTLQLPVLDPFASSLQAQFTDKQVNPAVGDANDLAGMPMDPFAPLRAGRATIAKLRIVDAFGQVRELDNPACLRAAAAIPPGPSEPKAVWFPPRLQQGARLTFRWLSASDDAVESADPASSPVCGWLLFNRVDDSLALYDADGTALGSLNRTAPVWRNAPNAEAPINQPIAGRLASANPHLRDFAVTIAGVPNVPGFLADLFDAIDATLTHVATATTIGAGGTGPLLARPLALVRARLDLELLGPPALDQSWTAFGEAVKAHVTGAPLTDTRRIARPDGGVAALEVPVSLGDLSASDDGLIGYVPDGTQKAFAFLSPAAVDHGNGVRPPGKEDVITVCADPAVAPVTMSMIVDPTAGVYAATGLLPRKRISIPPAMYAPALRNLTVTFEVTPALSARRAAPDRSDHVAIPVPSEPGFRWRWLTLVGGPQEPPTVDEAAIDSVPIGLGSPVSQLADGWLALSGKSAATDHDPKKGDDSQ
jgi:hypothetical protein